VVIAADQNLSPHCLRHHIHERQKSMSCRAGDDFNDPIGLQLGKSADDIAVNLACAKVQRLFEPGVVVASNFARSGIVGRAVDFHSSQFHPARQVAGSTALEKWIPQHRAKRGVSVKVSFTGALSATSWRRLIRSGM
jgi:hypothetical protein